MNTETKTALIISLLPGIILGTSIYHLFINNPEQELNIKVFNAICSKDKTTTRTMIMTYGEGTFYFLGNWTKTFALDQTYYIKYCYSQTSNRWNRNLVILEVQQIDP